MGTIIRRKLLKCLNMRLFNSSMLIILPIFIIILSAPRAEAFHAKVFPSRIHPGDAFMIRVTGLEEAAELSALFKKKPLHFSKCGKGCFVAIGAVDIKSKPGLYRISLKTGQEKTALKLSVLKGRFKTIHLTLPEDKVTLSPEDTERINRESSLLASIWRIESERL